MFLLDTNVVDELRKAGTSRVDSGVEQWANEYASDVHFLSVISLEELEIGVRRAERRDRIGGRALRRWMDSLVLTAFADRILPVDQAVALRSAALHVPDPKPVRDALIAATAIVHGLTLVTRNTRDFLASGVALVNPWERS